MSDGTPCDVCGDMVGMLLFPYRPWTKTPNINACDHCAPSCQAECPECHGQRRWWRVVPLSCRRCRWRGVVRVERVDWDSLLPVTATLNVAELAGRHWLSPSADSVVFALEFARAWYATDGRVQLDFSGVDLVSAIWLRHHVWWVYDPFSRPEWLAAELRLEPINANERVLAIWHGSKARYKAYLRNPERVAQCEREAAGLDAMGDADDQS